MPIYTLYTIQEKDVTVSGTEQLSGISQGDGSHLVGETLTFANDWAPVDIDEADGDLEFSDNDGSQTLAASITYNDSATPFAAGLRVEAEFGLTVEDPDGNEYTLLAFNINEPGATSYATVEGLVFVGAVPPFNVTLTVTASQEGPSFPYANLAGPPCFTAGCLIKTDSGQRPIEDLKAGDLVLTQDSGAQKIGWCGARHFGPNELSYNPKLRPVRILAGALGAGLPKRDMLVSRQHRFLVRSRIAERMFGQPEALVAAIRLTELPGVFVDEQVTQVTYHHILFAQHQVIFAEGTPTESLFTGAEALKSIPPAARDEIFTIFPELKNQHYAADPACLIPSGAAQRQLIARHLKNSKPLLG